MRALAAAVLLALAAGCEEDPAAFPVREVDRSARGPLADGAWASSPWPGDIDDLPREGLFPIEPGSGVVLLHGLGRVPVQVHCYAGFSEDPVRVMPVAGNSCEVHGATAESVTLRNGSGGSFFYRVVLR